MENLELPGWDFHNLQLEHLFKHAQVTTASRHLDLRLPPQEDFGSIKLQLTLFLIG
jgi:hypothetical protein